MPADLPAATATDTTIDNRPWYRLLSRYHWYVLIVAALGWLFDCLDQQLFILARQPAMAELLPRGSNIDAYSAYATSIFLMGWATGGLFFGVLGDRIGRARTMVITILVYSLCTGLSAISVSFWDFAFYRFVTGLGVGGEFAVGVALVAEVMPDRARPYTLGLLQALSAIGNISAALINLGMGGLQEAGLVDSVWRPMFLIGALPALLALLIRRNLKEPERWQQASHEGAVAKQLGSYRALFQHPVWRRHALIGLAMAFSGVVGLWAVGFYSIDLVGNVVEARFSRDSLTEATAAGKIDQAVADTIQKGVEQEGFQKGFKGQTEKLEAAFPETLREEIKPEATKKQVELVRAALAKSASAETAFRDAAGEWLTLKDVEREAAGQVSFWKSMTSIMINLGAALGMFSFGIVAQRFGRKPTFLIAFIAAAASTAAVLLYVQDFSQIFWMVPLMGVCQLSLFAGYAIYFPELFPTYLRSTGTSFCYNVGRFVAALGPALLGILINAFEGTRVERLRYAGLVMCSVFFIGLLVLPFAPETKDKPLPE